MPTLVRSRFLVSLLALATGSGLACSTRGAIPDDDGADASDSMEPSGDDPGDRPTPQGVMFSECQQSAECDPQEFCVFPQSELGYCTSACAAPTDPSNCDPPPGNQSSTCFDIDLDDGRWVCALDCSNATCPRGMRCESVATAGGERSICF